MSPITAHPTRLAFAGGPTLVGVDYDTSIEGTVRAYLHWWIPLGAPMSYEAVSGEEIPRWGMGPLTFLQAMAPTPIDIAPGDGPLRLGGAPGWVSLPLSGALAPGLGEPAPACPAPRGAISLLGGEMALKGVQWEPSNTWQRRPSRGVSRYSWKRSPPPTRLYCFREPLSAWMASLLPD